MKTKLFMGALVISAILSGQAQAKKTPSKDLLLYGAGAVVTLLSVSAGVGLVVHKFNVDKVTKDLDKKNIALSSSIDNLKDSVNQVVNYCSSGLTNLEEKMNKFHGVSNEMSESVSVMNVSESESESESEGEGESLSGSETLLEDSDVDATDGGHHIHLASDASTGILPYPEEASTGVLPYPEEAALVNQADEVKPLAIPEPVEGGMQCVISTPIVIADSASIKNDNTPEVESQLLDPKILEELHVWAGKMTGHDNKFPPYALSGTNQVNQENPAEAKARYILIKG